MLAAIFSVIQSALSAIGKCFLWCIQAPFDVLASLFSPRQSIPQPPPAEEAATAAAAQAATVIEQTKSADQAALVRRFARRKASDMSPPDISILPSEIQCWLQHLDQESLRIIGNTNVKLVTAHLTGDLRIGNVTWPWDAPQPITLESQAPWHPNFERHGKLSQRAQVLLAERTMKSAAAQANHLSP